MFTVSVRCFCIDTYINVKMGFDVDVDLEVLNLNIFEAWLVQVLAMEFLNHFRSVERLRAGS